MGLRPKPRKFFEKNLTKNFTAGKVFGLHSALKYTSSCHPERNEVKSNPEGVCETQDLRGDSKILLIDPASRPPYGRVRLRKRHTVTFSPLRMTHRGIVLR